ncbi:hypothetical protein GPJ56_006872 [Histomonas meleagridis]|uniref:uncharacterized protein n=1 Tax=Histomonas meleagridis TaxID=135588 RepID=UPI00355AC751|nr:hypothetical protein GPJ56_006872 [Histomonas meleagridis]KAH0802362.1 hypothetical protein GO595_004975 [Histomonas meleagridis]
MEGSTTLGQEYSMNLIKDATIQESDGNNFPVYIDSSQNAYDKYYNKIEKLNVNSDKFYTDAITHQKVPAVYNINDETDLEFPNPENYFSKEDYSNAVDKWYDRARSHYSTLRLPFPVSGQFYLPQMPKIWSKEEAKLPLSGRFKTFKVDTWNLLPTNYNEMVKLLFLKQPIDPEGQFPEQVPHRPAILYKHHISSESQWQSQMIPQEPEAITFDSFEEYEQTFVRWASLASSFIHNPLIPPNQFENIASLDIIPKEEKVPLKSPLLQFEPVNLDEWKKAPISSDFKKSFDNIKKRKSHHSRHTKTRRSSRVKVEKVNPFIEEFSQYGYILEHINSSAPICMPLNNIKIKIERSVKIDFEQENDVNDEFIRTFLQFSYSLEQIVESMKQKMGNGLTFMENFEKYISDTSKIKYILGMRNYVEQKYERLKTVAAVCQGLKAEDSIIYHEQIKALEQLSKDKTCCLTMSQIKPFMESVASHFLDSNPNISQKSWNFFLQLTSNHNVLLDAIKIPNVKTIMTSIANKDHITSLKNLLSFSIEIFQSKDGNELKKQIIEILLPSIGKLVTMYKMRNSIYKNNTQMKDLLQEFITTARKLKKDEFSEFQNALSKHLGDEKSSRSLIKTFTK